MSEAPRTDWSRCNARSPEKIVSVYVIFQEIYSVIQHSGWYISKQYPISLFTFRGFCNDSSTEVT
jgi:hypothetical protein